MVLFYANVSVEQKAKARGLGHLLGLIIGREEGEVPDIAGAKVSPTFFIRHVSERQGIFFFFFFFQRTSPRRPSVLRRFSETCWIDNAGPSGVGGGAFPRQRRVES